MKRRDFMTKLFAASIAPAALVACKEKIPKPRMKPVDEFMKMPKGKVTVRPMHGEPFSTTAKKMKELQELAIKSNTILVSNPQMDNVFYRRYQKSPMAVPVEFIMRRTDRLNNIRRIDNLVWKK